MPALELANTQSNSVAMLEAPESVNSREVQANSEGATDANTPGLDEKTSGEENSQANTTAT